MDRLGGTVRAHRERLGWSQAYLAQRVGYSDSSMIHQIEQGQKVPSLAKARQLAHALGISLCALVGDETLAELERRQAAADAMTATLQQLVAEVRVALQALQPRASVAVGAPD